MMNLAIRGIGADLGKFNADTFFNDCYSTLKGETSYAVFRLSTARRRESTFACIWNTRKERS
jgi:hypothetical protein